jgi:predicted O-methyltransferase YrrM
MNRYYKVMRGISGKEGYPAIMRGVQGMLYRKEAIWLHRIPKVLGVGQYIDLGTHLGRSACLLADTIRAQNLDAKVITVDTFDGRALSNRFKGDAKTVDTKLAKAMSNFQERDLCSYIKVICSESAKAAELVQGECAFVFIDAGHSYPLVKSDFEAWKDKVRDGGLIAFHDSNLEGIVKFHREIVDWEEFDRWETLSVWRRK